MTASLAAVRDHRRLAAARRAAAGRWARFVLMVAITAVVLAPLSVVLLRAVVGRDGVFAPQNLLLQLASGPTLTWFLNSAVVSVVTVVVTVGVAAPAAYALARARSSAVGAASLLLLWLQALPAMVLLPAMFVLLVHVGGADSLVWLTVLYIGFSLAVATWTLTSWFATSPIEIEQAAWLDGCTPLSAFVRVVLPNAAPVLVSTAVITFLFAWNDYWIALVFIQDSASFTLGLALVSSGSSPALALLALLPPVIVFLLLRRWFRFGGVAGSITG
jgi:multiple sugar transport system permease protein